MKTSTKTEFLIIGIICQFLGLLCFLTCWLMIYAAILFFIGSLFILISKKKWYYKIISLTPMFIAFGIIFNALYFEKYIIPQNFRGSVHVITDDEIGEPREYNFFQRIYRIPNSGVLFTKFNQKSAYNYREFYQENKNGKLIKLGTLDHRHYIEPWVYNPPKTEPSRDSFAVFTPQLERDLKRGNYKLTFYVGKYKDTKNWGFIPEEKIDSLRSLKK